MSLEDANIGEMLDGFLQRQREDNKKTLDEFRQGIDDLLRNYDLSEPARSKLEELANRLETLETSFDESDEWLFTSLVLVAALFVKVFDQDAKAIDECLKRIPPGGPKIEAFRNIIASSHQRWKAVNKPTS